VAAGACEVVVVDNASDVPVPPALIDPPPGVRLIRRRDNGGFAAGVNTGWRASRSPWLLLLNPDVVPGADLLGQVLERLERTPTGPGAPGIVGFALRNADGSRQPSVGPFPGLARSLCEQLIPRSRRKYQAGWRTRPGPVAWVTGACMLLNARLLHDLGGMDEDFFLYYEEVALCRSARRLGWRVEYDDRVEVVHLNPLQNRRVTPALRVITRHSKLLYFRKHLPRWQFVSLAWIVAAEAWLRRLGARALGRDEEVRAWRAIGRMARALRLGVDLRGPAVRRLAEAVAGPAARARPVRRADRRLLLRKDGPECRSPNIRSASAC
jgi:N-acetylglucosaminyl-diphospho-decaprenol L-rhamnosyltransferase